MNIDENEVKKFSELAEKWWDVSGEFKPLHIINPVRVDYIQSKINVEGLEVLDVGCGGGILSEGLFDLGAKVTGIDAAGPSLEVARIHAKDYGKDITYLEITAEELLATSDKKYDVVCCLEVLEHVPDPKALVKACISLLKPNGQLFLSTINKNPRSWITAIVGAEYLFNILPKGTHEFSKFIKPSELAKFIRDGGGNFQESKGMFYNPITHKANLNNDLGVNYLIHASK
ncbi:MAG: bifunctional 2-polyprenyl-6-hydroxyphenol methylase/3-demethylubiquinol 3-O-methyltransferase UbiG [Gammaproteobacteria bacterium]